MARYRSKPMEVEAFQWLPDDMEMAGAVIGTLLAHRIPSMVLDGKRFQFYVTKGGSNCIIEPGDWIIAESDGRGFYPCTAEAFANKYESVEVPA